MGMFLGIDAAASGLTAERLRMDVISNNIANATVSVLSRSKQITRRGRWSMSRGIRMRMQTAMWSVQMSISSPRWLI